MAALSRKQGTSKVSFQNGKFIPKEPEKWKCELYEHRKTGERVLAMAEDSEHVFSGPALSDETKIVQRLLAIRNKKTNKIRLVPVESFHLTPKTHVEKPASISVVTQEDKLTLGIKFGSKQRQRIIENSIRMRVDENMLKDQLSQVIDGVSEEKYEIPPTPDVSNNPYLPPANRNANTIEEVYNLHDFVSAEELTSLQEQAIQIMKDSKNFKKEDFSPFFWHCISKISDTGNSKQLLERFCLLLYADNLIKFLRTNMKLLRRQRFMICPYSEDISKKIMDTFSFDTPSGRTRPNSLKDKGICHLIVLGLLLSNANLDLEPLCKSLSVSVQRLQHFSRLIGAVSSKGSSVIQLRLPLPSSERRSTPRKRRN
ncbi:uncharacterized protein Polr1E isoform X2 [Periplaneta americana]|uniref:uncharacterized protein Polr1E isoform X2 n=1 Tax=Periplaneta americana TaxID=6978 RepID=UPI0037E819AE